MSEKKENDETKGRALVQNANAPAIVSPSLAKVLANETRAMILVEMNKRGILSVSEFQREFAPDRTVSTIAKHFRYLEREGCIELVDEKSGGKRRGSTERFYRAVMRSLLDASSWAELPESLKKEFTGTIFTSYIEQVSACMAAGTIDARPDRHFTWTLMDYDEIAWEELIALVDQVFKRSLELRVESALRLAESGGEAVPVTVALAAFESPKTYPPPSEIDYSREK